MATLLAGTYVWVDEPSSPSAHQAIFTFKSGNATYLSINDNSVVSSDTPPPVLPGRLYYYDGSEFPTLAYEPPMEIGGFPTWNLGQTVLVETDQTVNDNFHTWFTANTTFTPSASPLTFTPYYQGEEKTDNIVVNGETVIAATSGKAMTVLTITTNVPTNEGDPLVASSESELETLDTTANIGKVAIYNSAYYLVEAE